VSQLEPTDRTRLKRLPKRGHFDRATIDAILDEALICHLGFSTPDGPVVVPTACWRQGDHLYVHGSSASRAMRALSKGAQACVTVTLLDGLVLARSAFHHSMNFRSVMLFGTLQQVPDDDKQRVLERFVEHVAPGRWADLRPVNGTELRATTVLFLPITEASAKVRTGPPVDDDADYGWPVWAGVLPRRDGWGPPEPDPSQAQDLPVPDALTGYRRPLEENP
jgi:nitroimidazol reductase NimA-like FMN-containing flavoprotein (pyridoxamine 5'-phosphate oxidase superfamily)